MNTKDMIRELRNQVKKHENDRLFTGQLNIAAMCKDVADRLEELTKGCNGCKHEGQWENELEYGLNCPCIKCCRRYIDNYESIPWWEQSDKGDKTNDTN